MRPQDIKTLADVERWLRHYVEWSDEASRDRAMRAIDVIATARSELDAIPRENGYLRAKHAAALATWADHLEKHREAGIDLTIGRLRGAGESGR